jgi:CHAD domain-containing protein
LKARKVKGLDPEGPVEQELARVARVRTEELFSFAPDVIDPDAGEALHDMRIAAKRLRYLLEASAPALGERAEDGAWHAKKIQSLLGDLHDCDEHIPRVKAHLERLRAEDVAAVRAGGRISEAPNRTAYRGLLTLLTYLEARRAQLHAEFLERWATVESQGVREVLAGL